MFYFRYKAVSVSQELATPRESKSKKPHNPAWLPVMPNSSHLDAVPQATPISRTRVHNKKVWDFYFILLLDSNKKMLELKVKTV